MLALCSQTIRLKIVNVIFANPRNAKLDDYLDVGSKFGELKPVRFKMFLLLGKLNIFESIFFSKCPFATLFSEHLFLFTKKQTNNQRCQFRAKTPWFFRVFAVQTLQNNFF